VNNKDLLFQILKSALADHSNLHESGGELIQKAARQYLDDLQKVGFVPAYALEDVIEDLEIEAVDMYRKLTYGHYDLKEFRLNNRETYSGPKPQRSGK